MNLGQLRTEVRLRATVPSTDGMWTDTFVNSAINEALLQLSTEHPWPWLQESTTATPSALGIVDLSALTPLVRDIAHVFVGQIEAHPVSAAETDARRDPDGYTYSVWGDTLQIRPVTTDTVTVRYYANEAVMTADSDTPTMPAVYHPCIVEKACAVGFESLDDQSSAGMHEARARAIVAHMVATALRRIRGRHSVRVRAGHPY